ncbi:DNA mismatch repair protein mlh1 [Zychaea mexicana]|uniref:DNA mismatch repair protein mlh1 n=1 Tax=Zychaea mexicana TaxID=64656 RepID=UPI0022FDD6D5|nr:DNA mismatch repair protein mlh1 [Zychaea mexicana]KAI9498783.1 DNA mismatch repair protein mlh1 [Zychaea mexicana]
MSTVPAIKRLDQTVINRIAAGEIIQRPANALKELIENSLDAGATQIQILVKDGGIKLLQIQDNGHGIRKEDMGIVCERFTTSKLKKFEDLSQIATYGFRGEALASISHIAHVTITTKTKDAQCAFRANYSDGKLVSPRPGVSADPKPCAGNDGTQITAEDLFYNVPTRRRAFKSFSEEYNRIVDVVSRYAVHNSAVSFTCRKQGAATADVQTSSTSNITDTIRQMYGSSVASELLHVEKEFPQSEFKMNASFSNANYHVKKMTLLLFINNRLVESSNIKKSIENVYNSLLPKGSYPFVYLSLDINPRNVDVNVHPTKREVHFLNEDRIVDTITSTLQEQLEGANFSRTFYTQTILPGASQVESSPSDSDKTPTRKVQEYNLVRTDSRARTLDTFVQRPEDELMEGIVNTEDVLELDEELSSQPISSQSKKRPRIDVQMTSILNLRNAVKKSEHTGLTNVLRDHTFVGCADDTLALIQHKQDLYLVNFAVVSEELFYQVLLAEFCNFGKLQLTSPVSILECIKVALDVEEQQGTLPDQLQPKDTIAETITDVIVSRADMLEDHFSMVISKEGSLLALPMLLKGYVPTMDKLPLFLLRMGTEVDWETEEGCFDSLGRELAIFYSAEPPVEPVDITADNDTARRQYKQEHEKYLWQVQNLIFPGLKSQFIAPASLAREDGSYVTRLARLTDLYKIFERC